MTCEHRCLVFAEWWNLFVVHLSTRQNSWTLTDVLAGHWLSGNAKQLRLAMGPRNSDTLCCMQGVTILYHGRWFFKSNRRSYRLELCLALAIPLVNQYCPMVVELYETLVSSGLLQKYGDVLVMKKEFWGAHLQNLFSCREVTVIWRQMSSAAGVFSALRGRVSGSTMVTIRSGIMAMEHRCKATMNCGRCMHRSMVCMCDTGLRRRWSSRRDFHRSTMKSWIYLRLYSSVGWAGCGQMSGSHLWDVELGGWLDVPDSVPCRWMRGL